MSITATERTQIIELTTLMFNAAPGATYLSQIVALYEANGHKLDVLATQLAQTSVYASMNPPFQTSAEFAVKFLTPLGLQNDAIATDFVVSKLNAGQTKAQIVYAAFTALNNIATTDAAQYQAAKAILVNKTTVAEYYSAVKLGSATDLATLQTVIGSVTADPVSVTNAENAIDNAVITGVTFNLTTGVDTINGTSGNDTINGQIGAGGAGATLTGLDNINGGTGNDTLNVNDVAGDTGMPAGITVNSVETINIATSKGETVNTTTGFGGLTLLNISQSAGADTVTVGNGTAVSVTDSAAAAVKVTATDSAVTVAAAGDVTITGGSTQTVTTKDAAVTLTKATGAVSVTDTNQVGSIGIDDGTSVTVTSTATATGTISIGNVAAPTAPATHTPTGAVTVTQNLNGKGNLTGGAITITGGTVDSVTVNSTQATLDGAAKTTAGTVTVNGTSVTTTVSVKETAASAPVAKAAAVAGATTSDSVVFSAMTAGQSVTVGGLSFTATGAVTAAQAAAAFANLAAGATQGTSTLGTYSGSLAGFNTGAASTATVVATAATANAVVGDVAVASVGAAAPVVTNVTTGAAASAAVAGTPGIAGGAVNISDVNAGVAGKANTIATVTVDGYNSAAIASDALTSLSLANSAGAVAVNDITATTLALTVNNLGAGSTLNLDGAGATYQTLNITTAGKDSKEAITAAAVKALTVSGTNVIDLSGSAFSAANLKTVTVSGAAGVTMAATAAITDFNAAATSGAMTITNFDATKATYEGGTGTDKLTLTGAISNAISLGDGNDTLTLAAGTTSAAALVSGGNGTDTLVMVAADAVIASGSGAFASQVSGFEVLGLTGGTGAQLVHLDTLGGFNSVTTGGEANGGVLTMDGFVSGGTLTLTSDAVGTGAYVVSSAAFKAPTTDSFNIVLTKAGALAAGTVTASNIETINIAANDTTKAAVAGASVDTLTLVDTAATSITVTGNATLNLTSAGNTKVTSVDASGMTGGLTYTAAGGVAEVVKGGAAANHLTASAGTVLADTLIGGAAADVLTTNAGLDTLTGGGGNDMFVITSSANVNSYATITDAAAGDIIQFNSPGAAVAAETFSSAKVTLAGTAVFQDYANAAINGGGAAGVSGYITWFQFGGDTYVVESTHNATATHDFQNGADIIVKLVGLHDLSTASLNATTAGPALLQINS